MHVEAPLASNWHLNIDNRVAMQAFVAQALGALMVWSDYGLQNNAVLPRIYLNLKNRLYVLVVIMLFLFVLISCNQRSQCL